MPCGDRWKEEKIYKGYFQATVASGLLESAEFSYDGENVVKSDVISAQKVQNRNSFCEVVWSGIMLGLYTLGAEVFM